jgi:hypothetical protein
VAEMGRIREGRRRMIFILARVSLVDYLMYWIGLIDWFDGLD